MIKSLEDQFTVNQSVFISVPAEKMYFFEENGVRIQQGHEKYADYMKALRGY